MTCLATKGWGTFAREVHEIAVRLLEVDDSDPQSRALIQATLDLSRGLALANLLTDDSKRRRRVVATWADQLADALNVTMSPRTDTPCASVPG